MQLSNRLRLLLIDEKTKYYYIHSKYPEFSMLWGLLFDSFFQSLLDCIISEDSHG